MDDNAISHPVLLTSETKRLVWILALVIAGALFAGCQQARMSAMPQSDHITGTVRDAVSKKPIAGALVVAVSPAIDMRMLDAVSTELRFESVTDGEGRYQISIPKSSSTGSWSMKATHLGHETSTGSPMDGDVGVAVDIGGKAEPVDFDLAPALAITGHAVDAADRPIAGALVTAMLRNDHRGSYGYISVTETARDGGFVIYDYPVQAPGGSVGEIQFTHPRYFRTTIADVYQLTDTARASLRIVLPDGQRIRGRITDDVGHVVQGAVIDAETNNYYERKVAVTGNDGRFEILGLPASPVNLAIRAKGYDLQFNGSRDLTRGSISDEVFALTSMPIPAGPVHSLLGMTLRDATPEVLRRYRWDLPGGVLVSAATPVATGLGIGALEEGDLIWCIGDRKIGNLSEFLEEVLDPKHRNDDGTINVRVVYAFRRNSRSGSNTQYMALSAVQVAEVAELRRLIHEGSLPTRKP